MMTVVIPKRTMPIPEVNANGELPSATTRSTEHKDNDTQYQ